MGKPVEFYGAEAFSEVAEMIRRGGFRFDKGLCDATIHKVERIVSVNGVYKSVDVSDMPILSRCKRVIFPACVLRYIPEDVERVLRFIAIPSEDNEGVYDKLYIMTGSFKKLDDELACVCRRVDLSTDIRPVNFSLYNFISNTHKFKHGDYMLVCDFAEDGTPNIYVKTKKHDMPYSVEDKSDARLLRKALEREVGMPVLAIFALYHGDMRRVMANVVDGGCYIIAG